MQTPTSEIASSAKGERHSALSWSRVACAACSKAELIAGFRAASVLRT
jgi:hypothetical protein